MIKTISFVILLFLSLIIYKINIYLKEYYILFSIIVPVYNVENYLKECLESLIKQTYYNLEIICINDGSTDNSLQILKEYKKKDKRIKVINQKHYGVSHTRNNGIRISKGDFITFVDSDDFIDLNVFEKCVKKIINNNADIVVYQLIAENQKYQRYLDNKIYISDPYSAIRDYNLYPSTCNKIFRRKIIIENNIFFKEDVKYAEDAIFKEFAFIKATVIALEPSVIYHYVYRKNSAEHSLNEIIKIESQIKRIDYLYDFYKKNNELRNIDNLIEILVTRVIPLINIVKNNDLKNVYKLIFLKLYNSKLKPFINYNNISQLYIKKLMSFLSDFENIKNPKISVIVLIHNNGEYIKRFINSMQEQNLIDFEIIFIDKNSSDNSLNILFNYTLNDDRLIIRHENNENFLDSINYGMLISKGKYILLLSIKNIFKEDFLYKIFNKAEQTNADLLIIKLKNFEQKEYNFTNISKNNKFYNNFLNITEEEAKIFNFERNFDILK